MSADPIHVVLCFDDNFWAPAYAVMRSICIASKRRPDLNFHLCHPGLAAGHIADLGRIGEEYGASVHYYDLRENEVFRRVGLKARYSDRLTHVIYARLMVDHILPGEVKRVIYLDCDMYVRHPIEEMAELDLKGHPIAAVRDPHSHIITAGRDLRQNLDLFDPADPYFNSGFLVIDMAEWRKADVLGRLESMIEDGTMDRLYYDQDVLNLIFKHNWLRLPQMWNLLMPRTPHEAFDPALLHYTGARRPWNLVSMVAFGRVYRHVMTNELFYRFFWFRMRRRIKRWFHLK
ncbi:MAG: glycosyltransferase family 8 protein [Alphaproteobacteria bacterium]|nr:glycosyltransferase family 8 protein [Alphaproteobacteria bacterium]